jgi:nucleotide-binding universal stress UspA family protein
MNARKLLLAFDGSAQSLNAASLCWDLASKHPIEITAQHVVNTVGLWSFLDFELPGLTGSGPYIAARDNMARELRSIGETLVSIYQAKSEMHGVYDQCVLDEGDPVTEIMRRSKDNDIVVIGHHHYQSPAKAGSDGQNEQFSRHADHHSVAETLVGKLNKPLLVVQAQGIPWQRLELILHGNEGVELSFRAAAELANFLELPLEVSSYFRGEEKYQQLPDLTEQLKETALLYPNLDLKTRRAKLWPIDGDAHQAEVACREGTLVVIPTFAAGEGRRSAFGTMPELFVRHSGLSALLFWPADTTNAEPTLLGAAASSAK